MAGGCDFSTSNIAPVAFQHLLKAQDLFFWDDPVILSVDKEDGQAGFGDGL